MLFSDVVAVWNVTASGKTFLRKKTPHPLDFSAADFIIPAGCFLCWKLCILTEQSRLRLHASHAPFCGKLLRDLCSRPAPISLFSVFPANIFHARTYAAEICP